MTKPHSHTKSSRKQTGRAPKIDLKLARKVLGIVDAGLIKGLGEPVAGKMCVEAAVNFALGAPHGDEPACVGLAVRAFKIKLNDCDWSTDQARTDGMRKLAIAQLGSDKIDQMEFGKLVYLRGTQKLLPFVFRKVANDAAIKEEQKIEYRKHADLCEKVTTFPKAQKAVKDASACSAAYASAAAYAYASSAFAYASSVAYSSSAFAYASSYSYSAAASAYSSAYAYAYAYSAFAYAYASAAAYASASAWFKKNLGDDFLRLTADVGLGCLIELKSPGCKWLWLCDEKRAA